jgi:hypothetical protein
MNLGDDNYNHRVAQGQFNNRDFITIAGDKRPLNELSREIRTTAKEKTGPGTDAQIEELIGLLRFEANRLESTYINSVEKQLKQATEMSDQELMEALIEESKE